MRKTQLKTQQLFACGSLSRRVNGKVVMQRVTCCQRGMYRAPCECTEAPCTLSFQEQKDQVGEPLGCASPGSKAEEGKGNKARKRVNDTVQAWAGQGFTRRLQEPSQSAWQKNGPQRCPVPRTCMLCDTAKAILQTLSS